MNNLTKLGCFMTGWKPHLLSNCSEASYAMLKRYMAGMFILSIIWGVIGWCFAGNWMHVESWYGKLLTSAVSIFIIIQVERSILLAPSGGAPYTKWFRIGVAVVMAVLGSMIFDQIIFKEDVKREMIERTSTKVNEEIPKRTSDLERRITEITNAIDSISSANQELIEEYQRKPFIPSIDVTYHNRPAGIDENGNPRFETDRITTSRSVANPVVEQIKINENRLKEYRERETALQDQKINIWNETQSDYESRVGLLEEMKALFAVIFDKEEPIAGIFYIILFLFLMCLELLVVTTYWSDNCDYKTLVDFHQTMYKKGLEEKLKQS